MKKIINGIEIELTQEDIAQRQSDEQAWLAGAFDRAISTLRAKRNKLLADTDYLALSDNTMTEEMKVYRQKLRDITEGLTTLAKVNKAKLPEKP